MTHHSDRIEYALDSQFKMFNQWVVDDVYGLAIEFDTLPEVERMLEELLETAPDFSMLVLTDLQGHILVAGANEDCEHRPVDMQGRMNQDALIVVDFNDTRAFMSHADPECTLGSGCFKKCCFGYACRDSAGQINGVLLGYPNWTRVEAEIDAASEHLARYGYRDATVSLHQEGEFEVLASSWDSNDGEVDWFNPDCQAWLSDPVNAGKTQRFQWDGQIEYLNFRPIGFEIGDPRGQNTGIMAVASLSDEDILGSVRRELMFAILMVAIGIPILWGFLWLITGRIVTPLLRLSQTVQRMGRGDLTSFIEVGSGGEMGALECSFASMKRDLTDILADVKQAVQEIIAAGIHIQCASEQQALETKEQASAVSETAAAAAELSTTSKHIGENVGHVTEVADRVLQGMDHIRVTTRETSGLLGLLNDKSKQIVGIVGLINTVADKTNMLAVNASIEAARAGEQGRGFAVVADQITRLARSTATSAKGISELIEEIQRKMFNAIETMERSVEGVEDGIELAQTSVQTAKEISMSANQQVVCSKQISEAMSHIDDAMGRINQDAQNSTQIATELTQVADRLQEVVARFKVVDTSEEAIPLDR